MLHCILGSGEASSNFHGAACEIFEKNVLRHLLVQWCDYLVYATYEMQRKLRKKTEK
jgi:hypothetical protein